MLLQRCSNCESPLVKVIYAGLPGKLCEHCGRLTGLATIPVTVFFNGFFFIYDCNYFKALWMWLKGVENEFESDKK